MNDAQPSPRRPAILIPLDDREALLALRDYDRHRRGGTAPGTDVADIPMPPSRSAQAA